MANRTRLIPVFRPSDYSYQLNACTTKKDKANLRSVYTTTNEKDELIFTRPPLTIFDRFHIKQPKISKWERNKNRPKVSRSERRKKQSEAARAENNKPGDPRLDFLKE